MTGLVRKLCTSPTYDCELVVFFIRRWNDPFFQISSQNMFHIRKEFPNYVPHTRTVHKVFVLFLVDSFLFALLFETMHAHSKKHLHAMNLFRRCDLLVLWNRMRRQGNKHFCRQFRINFYFCFMLWRCDHLLFGDGRFITL
jgi:hypothetical protein